MKKIQFILLATCLTVFLEACKDESQSELPNVQPELIIHEDGSFDGPFSPDNLQPTASKVETRSDDCVFIDFDDLTIPTTVNSQYSSQGVYVSYGPNGTTGNIIASGSSPCGGTKSLISYPFVGPSFLFNFPGGVSSVSIDAGDSGPSDEDIMTITAYSGENATGSVVATDTKTLPLYHPTGCLNLSVTGTLIKSVEVTTVSTFPPSSSFPNSVFVDNLYFCPILDADGDGCNDNVDPHPNSIPDETVIIDGCNSGVPNLFVSADGCSNMSDLIADAAAAATTHGNFVSAVAALTNAWKNAGYITGAQKGAIQSCASQANIPPQ